MFSLQTRSSAIGQDFEAEKRCIGRRIQRLLLHSCEPRHSRDVFFKKASKIPGQSGIRVQGCH